MLNTLAQSSPWANIAIGEQLTLFSPLLALVGTMLLVVLCPLTVGRGSKTIAGAASIGVFVTLLLAFDVGKRVLLGGTSGLSTDPAAGLLIVDNLSVGYQIILYVFLAAVMWLWWMGSAEKERNAPEFFILLLGSAFGMALMVSSVNLLMIVIAIETASLPSYAIVGFDKRDRKGAEASLKYVVFGAVSAAIMLYGASLIYGLVGSLNVGVIAEYVVQHFGISENKLLMSLALFCFLGGIAFKISAVPFHFWCPDAFEGAKIEVTTWLSVASKAAGLILLVRIVLAFCHAVESPPAMTFISPIAWTIGIMAAVTCTVGNFSAYKQQSVKRLLAYSSIAHAGYMMMAAAVFLHPSTAGYSAGVSSLVYYIVIYMLMNLGAFSVTACVQWDTGSDDIDSFTGLIRRNPFLAVPMVICLMSLVGLPPLAGFLGKWWILMALGSMQGTASAGGGTFATLGWFLVIVAGVNTLISLYFYLRIVVQMTLRDKPSDEVRAPIGGVAMANLCAVLLLVLFFFGGSLKNAAERYTKNIYPAGVTNTVNAKVGDASLASTESAGSR